MIRVLHIINTADYGGISSMLLNYYRHIDRDRVRFDFALSVDWVGHDGHEMEKLGAKLFYLPIKSKGYRRHVRVLKSILKEGNYDAIHVHSALTSWVDLRVAKRCGIKVRVAHAHNADKSKHSLKNRFKRWVGTALMRRYATLRLSCSRDATVYTFGTRALSEPSVQLLPNAIESDRFLFDENSRSAIRRELGIDPEDFVLGTVGRMTGEKNQIHAVRVFPEVLARIPNSRLLLVGDGVCRKAMEAEAEGLGIADRVIFTGGRSDVPQLLAAMDVFILPSFQEGFGIAALEAAASGLPVVLSDVIPRELAFIPGHAFVSLQAPLSVWAEQICAYRAVAHRETGVRTVRDAGYDIAATAERLEKIYAGRCEEA